MTRRFKRWLSILVLGALAFSQASLVLAACVMDRGELAQVVAAEQAPCDCCDEAGVPGSGMDMPMSPNGCVAHCNADLQAAGFPAVIVHAPVAAPLLVVPSWHSVRIAAASFIVPPPAGVPPRILLHSFQV